MYVTRDKAEAINAGLPSCRDAGEFIQQVETLLRPIRAPATCSWLSSEDDLVETMIVGVRGDVLRLELGSRQVSCDISLLLRRPGLAGWMRRPLGVGVRPEHILASELADELLAERRIEA